MTLKVGIVGAGNIFARGYLPALRHLDSVSVTGICDIDPQRAEDAAAEFEGARTSLTHEDLLASGDFDAVFVLTPAHTHAAIAIAALEAGAHVLCEKPMAPSVAEARRMAEAAARTGRRLMVGHTRRFDERWTAINEQLRSGRIGEPVYLFRSEHAYNGAPADAWQWQETLGGGALWDVGIHLADLAQWYFGASPRTAFTKLLHARSESVSGGAPDAAVVTLDFGPRRHALLSVSWIHPPAWGPFYATMELVGTQGRLDYRDIDAHPTLTAHGDALAIPRYSPLLSATATAFRNEVAHFADAIESGTPFAISTEDALRAVETIDAAERSARSGRPEAVGS